MIKQQPDLLIMNAVEPPNVNMFGILSDGYGWLKWPENSVINWYRAEGKSSEWSRNQT